MRHKLRHCQVCGQTFVDRAEIAERCFDCRSGELRYVQPDVAQTSTSAVGLSSSSIPVVMGATAAQLAAPPGDCPAQQSATSAAQIKLWEREAKQAPVSEKTEWSSPAFRVRFEDHVDDADVPAVLSPAPRQKLSARYKVLLAAAIILAYCFWPSSLWRPPDDDQLTLIEQPANGEFAPQEADPAASQQPDAEASETPSPSNSEQ